MRALFLSLLLVAAPASALNEGLQCVPYARALSGIEIRGDAYTWWNQAAGKYERGSRPRVGAVMAFTPYGKMHLGHVAAVSRIIDRISGSRVLQPELITTQTRVIARATTCA